MDQLITEPDTKTKHGKAAGGKEDGLQLLACRQSWHGGVHQGVWRECQPILTDCFMYWQ